MAAEWWIVLSDRTALIWGKSAKNWVERSTMQNRESDIRKDRGRNSEPEEFREIFSTFLPSTKKEKKNVFTQNIGTGCNFSANIWCKVKGRRLHQFQLNTADKIIPGSWSTWRLSKDGVLSPPPPHWRNPRCAMGWQKERARSGVGEDLGLGEAPRALGVRHATQVLMNKKVFLHFDLEHP